MRRHVSTIRNTAHMMDRMAAVAGSAPKREPAAVATDAVSPVATKTALCSAPRWRALVGALRIFVAIEIPSRRGCCGAEVAGGKVDSYGVNVVSACGGVGRRCRPIHCD